VVCQFGELVTRGGGMGGTIDLGREESRILRLRRRWLELATDDEGKERIELSNEARTGTERSSPDKREGTRGSSASEPPCSLNERRSESRCPTFRDARRFRSVGAGLSYDLLGEAMRSHFGPLEIEARDEERFERDP